VDPLSVLRRTAGHDAPEALAERGLALAMLDELDEALSALQRARSGFLARGDGRSVARCRAAMLEIAAFRRELDGVEESLAETERELEELGDAENAAWMRVVRARLAVLFGRGGEALALLEAIGVDARLSRHTRAVALLAAGEHALRARRAALARDLFAAAAELARDSHPTLVAEVERAIATLSIPIAEWIEGGERNLVAAPALEARTLPRVMGGTRRWVLDGLRGVVLAPDGTSTSLSARPVLLALLVRMGSSAPDAVDWHELAKAAFGVVRPNDSHRARLKVELGRLRSELPEALGVASAGSGRWALVSRDGARVATLLPHPERSREERVLALLADGRAWRSAEVALALGLTPRMVQRELELLRERGLVQPLGAGRRTRWRAPGRAETIASQMLLLGMLSDS